MLFLVNCSEICFTEIIFSITHNQNVKILEAHLKNKFNSKPYFKNCRILCKNTFIKSQRIIMHLHPCFKIYLYIYQTRLHCCKNRNSLIKFIIPLIVLSFKFTLIPKKQCLLHKWNKKPMKHNPHLNTVTLCSSLADFFSFIYPSENFDHSFWPVPSHLETRFEKKNMNL